MTLQISGSRTISEVKSDFNKVFPYLKLEFSIGKHNTNGKTPARQLLSDEVVMDTVIRKLNGSTIEFSDQSSVEEFEKNFFELFGIYAQVYRRSGKIWLETNMTDKWTLRMQNEHGREITEI